MFLFLLQRIYQNLPFLIKNSKINLLTDTAMQHESFVLSHHTQPYYFTKKPFTSGNITT